MIDVGAFPEQTPDDPQRHFTVIFKRIMQRRRFVFPAHKRFPRKLSPRQINNSGENRANA